MKSQAKQIKFFTGQRITKLGSATRWHGVREAQKGRLPVYFLADLKEIVGRMLRDKMLLIITF